jgi:hypothetical protein
LIDQDILATERSDTIIRQQALGALQKLSLRRMAQSKMIEVGGVDWILKILSDVDSIRYGGRGERERRERERERERER